MKASSHLPGRWSLVYASNFARTIKSDSAKVAHELYGADPLSTEGTSGRSFGIPTLDKNLDPLSLDEVRQGAAKFLRFAEQRPDLTFQVCRIENSSENMDTQSVAEIFEECPKNVLLPRKWYLALDNADPEFRLILAGNPAPDHYQAMVEKLDTLLSKMKIPVRIVCASTGTMSQMAERYATENDYFIAFFELNHDLFKNAAQRISSESMVWYSDALFVLWDENDDDVQSLIDIAERENLPVREAVISDLSQKT